jgi:hypothetical protein
MVIQNRLKKQYQQALNFYASKLFTPQLNKNIEVRVRFCNFEDNLKGIAIVDDYNASGKPRSFTIEVNRNESQSEILKTLAHELVHCRQYAQSELNEEMTVWHGKKINSDEMPYEEQPWEIEAEMMGLFLYESFIATQTH